MRKNLIKWEVDNGYKAKFVAEKLGITESKWSNIKNSRINPQYALLQRFQDTFKPTDIISLFAEESDNELQQSN